jgi:hypothetical protein
MSKRSTAPYVVRWRDALLADEHPALTWRAITAAMALTVYADVKTGHNCYPGATACARKMRVSVDTIKRGWAELVEAGWLKIHALPEERRRMEGALKELRFPGREPVADSNRVLTAPHLVADSHPTIPGNEGSLQDPPETLEAGRPEGWDALEREARAQGLVCSSCDRAISFFPRVGSTLCRTCLEEEK